MDWSSLSRLRFQRGLILIRATSLLWGWLKKDYFEIGKKVGKFSETSLFCLGRRLNGQRVGMDIDSLIKGYEETLKGEKEVDYFFVF